MKKRGLVIGLLIMLALVTSGFTYAFWASDVTGNNDTATGTVTIGEGDTVATTVTVGDVTNAGELVPVGFAAFSTGSPVEYVILSFSVVWESDNDLADGYTGTLGFVASDVEIDGADTYAGLVNITFQIGGTVTGGTLNGDGSTAIIADGAAVTVYVKLTLNEPANQTEYTAVAGKDITFTGTFTVTA